MGGIQSTGDYKEAKKAQESKAGGKENSGSSSTSSGGGTPAASASSPDSSSDPSAKKPACKACCACPETKKARDACIMENGEENCGPLIEAHKKCMRDQGFNI